MRITLPIEGKYTVDQAGNVKGDGEVLSVVSLSELFAVYGMPVDVTGGITTRSSIAVDEDGELTATAYIIAEDPSEQTTLDLWAAPIGTDGADAIRSKVAAEPSAVTMRPLTKRELGLD